MSAIALFSHIEQQLNALRAKALKDLEEKVITPSPATIDAYIVPRVPKARDSQVIPPQDVSCPQCTSGQWPGMHAGQGEGGSTTGPQQ